MIKQLVSFGCSWTFGDELIDPSLRDNIPHSADHRNNDYRDSHSFPGLIANHFGWDYQCLAYPGCSLQAMIWNLNWWLDNTSQEIINESFIISGLTEESRNSWYNPYHQHAGEFAGLHRYMHSSWLMTDAVIKDEPYMDEWREFSKLYLVLSDCNATRELNFRETVRFFDGVSARFEIPMLQLNVLSNPRTINAPTISTDEMSISDFINAKSARDSMIAAGGHPNEKAHQIISEHLIPQVRSVILNR